MTRQTHFRSYAIGLAVLLASTPLLADTGNAEVKLGHIQRPLNVPHSFIDSQDPGIDSALPIAAVHPIRPIKIGAVREGHQYPVIHPEFPFVDPDE